MGKSPLDLGIVSFPIWSLRNPVALSRVGLVSGKTQIVLGPNNKKSPRALNLEKSCPIDIPPVHDVDGSRFENQFVQPFYVVYSGFGNVDADGDWSPQIQLRVKFDTAFC